MIVDVFGCISCSTDCCVVIIMVHEYACVHPASFSHQYDDVIIWKHFPCHWPFARGIHRSPVNSPHKDHWRRTLMFYLICTLNKRLSKQSWGWWFETRSLWCHCNESDVNEPHGVLTHQQLHILYSLPPRKLSVICIIDPLLRMDFPHRGQVMRKAFHVTMS